VAHQHMLVTMTLSDL